MSDYENFSGLTETEVGPEGHYTALGGLVGDGEYPGAFNIPDGLSIAYVDGTDSLGLPEREDAEDPMAEVWLSLIDNDEAEKLYKATKPPGGYYEVQGLTATRTLREVEYVGHSEDSPVVVKKVRPTIRFYGQGTRTTEQGEYKARISFNISPVVAYKRSFETKEILIPLRYDRDHEMFQLARRAYAVQNPDQKTFTVADIEEYLKSYPLRVRTMQGSTDLVVLGFEAVKPS